jgi:hypothetical protein
MTFHWTTMTLLMSVAVLAVALGCCVVSWQRSGRRRNTGLLECFRFSLIALAVVALNQPERIETFRPAEKPGLVVLHDTSLSMQTKDVISAGTATPNTATAPETGPITRQQAIQPAVQSDFWTPLKDRMDIVIQTFSSELPVPERGTDLQIALRNAYDQHPGLRGIVLLSDGDWNTGESPGIMASQLRTAGIPVIAVCAGSEDRLPDLELTATDTAVFGVVGKVMRIPFRIHNWLPVSRDLTLTLTDSGGQSVQKQLRVAGMGQVQDTIEWKPAATGDNELTLSIPVDDAELRRDNNECQLPVSVREEELRVLIVDASPRWEYRYLRNALERDPGVDVNCLLFHPDLNQTGGGRGYLEQFPSEKDLFTYDVVFLGDVGTEPGQLTAEHCEQLRQLVRSHAAGLVFLPGFHGRQQSLSTTPLEELFPVVLDAARPAGIGSPAASRYQLTEAGRRSLLTRLEPADDENERTWSTLPGFHWHAAAQRARIGSQVLVVHDTATNEFGRVPLVVTRPAGTGKVLFMGTDSAWRWRRGIEDLYHYRFWGQVVRWMAYQRNMSRGESIRLFYSPDRPLVDSVMTLNANVMDPSGEPLRAGTVTVNARSPSGKTSTVQLPAAGEDSWGLFSGTFKPDEAGRWTLMTTCAETSARIETSISVVGQEKEQIGQPARPDVLKELADVSRGRLLTTDQMSLLTDLIAELPEPEPSVRRIRFWSHPAMAGVMILLLGIFWTLRKLAGLV